MKHKNCRQSRTKALQAVYYTIREKSVGQIRKNGAKNRSGYNNTEAVKN